MNAANYTTDCICLPRNTWILRGYSHCCNLHVAIPIMFIVLAIHPGQTDNTITIKT